MGASARDSCEGRSHTPDGVKEHVESIIIPPTGRQVNVYLHLNNVYFINFINDMRLCLQEEVYLYTGDKDHKIVVGLTQPQLGGYDSYVHGRLVGHGNARVLVQTCLVVTSLLYIVNDEINTTIDVVGTFVIWPEFLLVPINASVSYLYMIC